MPFLPGNKLGVGNARKPKVVYQQLIAELNEAASSGEPNRLRKVVKALISRAEDGDVAAAKEIFDRVDGKVPQALTGPDGDEPLKIDMGLSLLDSVERAMLREMLERRQKQLPPPDET